ncbi:MAG: acylphosphatase [Ignavibacteriales bacterium]|nr:acylphosphatase [Ignavibacteriales bacterium]
MHIVVQGVVQGVGFRYFVLLHATRLGLNGWVRNLYSSEVEIEVEGDRSMVEELIKEIKIGPRSAHVKDLNIEWQEFKNRFKGFEIR